jgi:hypothetical protein
MGDQGQGLGLSDNRENHLVEPRRGGENNEIWKLSVSFWMKAAAHFEKYHKTRVLSYFKQKYLSSSKKHIYKAFETYGRLLRGFKKFKRSLIHQKRLQRFREKRLLTTSFQSWVRSHHNTPLIPTSRGCFVSACFKWIILSFSNSEPKYYLLWLQHQQLLLTYSQSKSSIFGQLDLPKKRIPLFLHAMGILDAFHIRSFFSFWYSSIQQILKFKLKRFHRIKVFFFKNWKSLVQNIRSLRQKVQILYHRTSTHSLHYFFHQWIGIFYSSKSFSLLCQKQLHHFFLLLKKLKISSSYQQDLILQAQEFQLSFTLLKTIRQWKYRSALATYHSQRSDAVTICLQRFFLSRGLMRWNRSSRSVWKLRYRHYFDHRCRLLTSHLSHNTHSSILHLPLYTSPSSFSSSHSSPPSTTVLWCHLTKNYVLVSCRLRFPFLHWYHLSRRTHHFITLSSQIQRRSHHSLLQHVFGVWLMKSLSQMNYHRLSNQLIMKTFFHLQRRAFQQWKSYFGTHLEIQLLVQQHQHNRRIDLHRRLCVWKEAIKEYQKKSYFKSWKVYRQRRQQGRKFKQIFKIIFCWNCQRLAWCHWKHITNLSVIVTCLQKYWRGYYSRHYLISSYVNYLKWLRNGNYLLKSQSIYQKNLLKGIFKRWIFYLTTENKNIMRNTTRVQLHNSLLRWYHVIYQQRRRVMMMRRGHESYRQRTWRQFLKILRRKIKIRKTLYWIQIQKRKKLLLSTLKLFCLYSPTLQLKRNSRGFASSSLHHSLHSPVRVTPTASVPRPHRMTRYHREVTPVIHHRKYSLLNALHQLKLYQTLHHHLSLSSQKCDQLFKLKQSIHDLFLAWAHRAHRWSMTDSHPIILAHRHHIHYLLKKGWKLFQSQIIFHLKKKLQQFQIQKKCSRKYFKKQLFQFFRRWYNKSVAHISYCHQIELRRIQPFFFHWLAVYQNYFLQTQKIKFLQIKIWRRLLTGLFLHWKLFSLRSKRYFDSLVYLQHQVRHRALEKVWRRWENAIENKKYLFFSNILKQKSSFYLKLKYLKMWRKCYFYEKMYQKKLIRVLFVAWARYVREEKMSLVCHEKAVLYHFIFSCRWALRVWRWRIQQKKQRRMKFFQRIGQMDERKCRKIIQYWRQKCWWLGRRVLHGKTRFSHPPRMMNMNRSIASTHSHLHHRDLSFSIPPPPPSSSWSPHSTRKSIMTPRFGSEDSDHLLFNSGNTLHRPVMTPLRVSMFKTDEMRVNTRATTPRSPYSSSKRPLFNQSSVSFDAISTMKSHSHTPRYTHHQPHHHHLLIFGRTPLAHEASQLWALRRWKKNIIFRKHTLQLHWKIQIFFHWKKYSFEVRHRHQAAQQRFQKFMKLFLLQKYFSLFQKSIKSDLHYSQLCQQIHLNHLTRVWFRWKALIQRNWHLQRRHKSIFLILTSKESRSSQDLLRRAYQYWRIRVRLQGLQTKKNSKLILSLSLLRWKHLFAATHLASKWLKIKSFRRWKERVRQMIRTRDHVVAQQKFVTLVLNKIRRRCGEWLREAFSHWCRFFSSTQTSHFAIGLICSLHSPSSSSHPHSILILVDWKSEIQDARSISGSPSLATRRTVPLVAMESNRSIGASMKSTQGSSVITESKLQQRQGVSESRTPLQRGKERVLKVRD